jgi:hypothetical protein
MRKKASEGDQYAKEQIDRDNARVREYWKNLRKSAKEGDQHAKKQINK